MAAVPSHSVIAADAEHDHEKGALRLAEHRGPATRIKRGTSESGLEGGANICGARLLPRRSSVTQLLFKLSCSCKCVLTVGDERHKSWNGKHHNKRKHDGVEALATCLEFGTPVRSKLRDSISLQLFEACSPRNCWQEHIILSTTTTGNPTELK